jgi:ATPase subunit of ABC transporter with duplicated ATPase domains
MQSQSVMLILRFADSGWHVRWRTPNTEVFQAVLEEFKALLDLTERYWDPEAFEKGGWWVAYGALNKVGHLFSNYQALRDEMEREYWQRYEQQRKEARNRAAQSEQKQETGQETKQQNQQPRREEKREEAKLPRTSQEAFRILSLVPPVTLNDVKRAYRMKAFTCHPDRGGSHAQMVVINAAFELAQKAVS